MKSRSSSCPFPLSHRQLLQNQMIPNKATVNNLASHDPFSLYERPWHSHLSTSILILCGAGYGKQLQSAIHTCLSISMALKPFVRPWPLFLVSWSFTQSEGPLGQGISPSQGRYLNTGQHKQNKCIQTSMPQVGFELMIPVFEGAKTVHALDRAATVIARYMYKSQMSVRPSHPFL
jgi:hypothetical protein